MRTSCCAVESTHVRTCAPNADHPTPAHPHLSQGPILLSLLSVFYNLHSEFMGSGGGGGLGTDGRPQHRLWSVTPLTGAAKQQTAAKQVRLSGAPPSVMEGIGGSPEASPQRSASLQIHVPRRHGEPSEGDAYSPAAPGSPEDAAASPNPLPEQQQPRPFSQSASLNLRPGESAPAGPEESESDEADSNSGSVGNSFSFGLLSGAASSGKLHDD